MKSRTFATIDGNEAVAQVVQIARCSGIYIGDFPQSSELSTSNISRTNDLEPSRSQLLLEFGD